MNKKVLYGNMVKYPARYTHFSKTYEGNVVTTTSVFATGFTVTVVSELDEEKKISNYISVRIADSKFYGIPHSRYTKKVFVDLLTTYIIKRSFLKDDDLTVELKMKMVTVLNKNFKSFIDQCDYANLLIYLIFNRQMFSKEYLVTDFIIQRGLERKDYLDIDVLENVRKQVEERIMSL